LGHRRLSIIDLATGHQPMANARKDLWIVFNGEIYNFLELRKNLETLGYVFQTNSDTEVILQLYDHYGTACVNHLRGMFALAIWDQRHQRLFLARDRVGKKPLFYVVTPDAITFASEIKALLQDATVKRELNLPALSHYLTYQYVPPPNTMFQGIYKLPPAHTLVCENRNITLNKYWELRYLPKASISENEAVEVLADLLQEVVKIRMISDVPLGVFLSGGIDSSLVAALMAEASPRPVKTFSIGFHEKVYNELPYARLIVERYNTDHQELIVNPSAVDILPKLVWYFDEPFADSSAIPTYYLAQMTSQHVKVALNGDGGDESFAGYLRYLGYKAVRYYRQIPYGVRKHVMSPLLDKLSVSPLMRHYAPVTLRRLKFLNTLSLQSPEQLYARTLTIFDETLKGDLLAEDVRNQLAGINALDYILCYFQSDHVEHITDRMLYSDVSTYLPGDLLVKMDRMTMAHGLEGRSPFLDHKVMEFAATLPVEYKLRRTCLKYLLKKVGKPWLPERILTREKQGFGVPLGQWFQHELREMVDDIVASSSLVQEGILNPTALHQIWQEHRRGQVNHYHRIWSLLNLELWYRMFIRGSCNHV
jgi:asparagine synthase (glutamine-hydrolysing)